MTLGRHVKDVKVAKNNMKKCHRGSTRYQINELHTVFNV